MTNLFSVSALFIMYREALEACVVISVMLSIMGRLGLHRLKRQGDPPLPDSGYHAPLRPCDHVSIRSSITEAVALLLLPSPWLCSLTAQTAAPVAHGMFWERTLTLLAST